MGCWAGSRRFPTRVRPRAARVVRGAAARPTPVATLVTGGREAAGGAAICPGVRPPRTPAWPRIPDIGRPDGGHSEAADGQSADRLTSFFRLWRLIEPSSPNGHADGRFLRQSRDTRLTRKDAQAQARARRGYFVQPPYRASRSVGPCSSVSTTSSGLLGEAHLVSGGSRGAAEIDHRDV